jgi:acyl carrier protein
MKAIGCMNDSFDIIINEIDQELKNPISAIDGELTDYYGLDSLAFMTLISEIEKRFNIEFREDITFNELNDYKSLLIEIKIELCHP